jgi:hypothetical protein
LWPRSEVFDAAYVCLLRARPRGLRCP